MYLQCSKNTMKTTKLTKYETKQNKKMNKIIKEKQDKGKYKLILGYHYLYCLELLWLEDCACTLVICLSVTLDLGSTSLELRISQLALWWYFLASLDDDDEYGFELDFCNILSTLFLLQKINRKCFKNWQEFYLCVCYCFRKLLPRGK